MGFCGVETEVFDSGASDVTFCGHALLWLVPVVMTFVLAPCYAYGLARRRAPRVEQLITHTCEDARGKRIMMRAQMQRSRTDKITVGFAGLLAVLAVVMFLIRVTSLPNDSYAMLHDWLSFAMWTMLAWLHWYRSAVPNFGADTPGWCKVHGLLVVILTALQFRTHLRYVINGRDSTHTELVWFICTTCAALLPYLFVSTCLRGGYRLRGEELVEEISADLYSADGEAEGDAKQPTQKKHSTARRKYVAHNMYDRDCLACQRVHRSKLQSAGWCSQLTFWWVQPLMSKGKAALDGSLEFEDLDPLHASDTSHRLYLRLWESWTQQVNLAKERAQRMRDDGEYDEFRQEGRQGEVLDPFADPEFLWAHLLPLYRQEKLDANGNVQKVEVKTQASTATEDGEVDADSKEQAAASQDEIIPPMPPNYPKPSLIWALVNAFGRPFIFAGVEKFFYDALQFVGPFILNAITKYLSNGNTEPDGNGYIYTGVLLVSAICATLILQQYFFTVFRVSGRVRTATIAAVFRKSLRLSSDARTQASTGEIVSLMSTDARTLQQLLPYLHIIWSGPVQIVISVGLLWRELGASMLAGLLIMIILLIPINMYMAKTMRRLTGVMAKVKDKRLKVTGETITHVEIVKMYAWEESFEDKVKQLREEELRSLKTFLILNTGMRVMWNAVPLLVAVCAFTSYSLAGNDLTAAKAFTSLALFNILTFPLSVFPRIAVSAVASLVTIRRLQAFLLASELEFDYVKGTHGDVLQSLIHEKEGVTSVKAGGKSEMAALPAPPPSPPLSGDQPSRESWGSQSPITLDGSTSGQPTPMMSPGRVSMKDGFSEAYFDFPGTTVAPPGTLQPASTPQSPMPDQVRLWMPPSTPQGSLVSGDATLTDLEMPLFTRRTLPPVTSSTGAPVVSTSTSIPTSRKVDPRVRAPAGEPVKRPVAISVRNGTFYWDGKRESVALEGLNFECYQGELVVVVGETGSGKTALLNGILGDLIPERGDDAPTVTVDGSIALATQKAWIRNCTFRENVTFLSDYDAKKYQEVVDACALLGDIDVLPAQDMTEIGSKGINLSGGQKQRVGLARCIYEDADIYMLDDTLSAVDAHVGRHIINECILRLLADKTVLLVTHHMGLLGAADRVIVMENGRMIACGSPAEVQKQGVDLIDLCAKLEEENKRKTDAVRDGPEPSGSRMLVMKRTSSVRSRVSSVHKKGPGGEGLAKRTANAGRATRTPSVSTSQLDTPKLRNRGSSTAGAQAQVDSSDVKVDGGGEGGAGGGDGDEKEGKDGADASGQLTKEEGRASGSVSWSVYKSYFKALGGWGVFVVFVLGYVINSAAGILANRWLAEWSVDSEDKTEYEGDTYYIVIYALISLSAIVALIIGLAVLAYGSLRASRSLHNGLLHTLMRAPMSLFHATPIGRILNRFSSDINTVDNQLWGTVAMNVSTALRVVSIVVVISTTTWMFAIALIPLAITYWQVQNYYIRTSRAVKRWDSVLASPIYSHFAESLDGVQSIRAFGCARQFTLENEALVDAHNQAFFAGFSINRWLAVRLETLGSLIVTLAALFAVVARGDVNAGLGAMSISYAMMVTQTLNWMVRMNSEREMNIVAVERIREYASETKEAPLHLEGPDAPKLTRAWPTEGGIVFDKVKLRYRPHLPLVLKDMSVQIRPGEKVGICGRTGAGKSSLLLALMRIVEVCDGQIRIDGVDARTLGLHDVRGRISIIPQEPVLFSGSVRFNLAPHVEMAKERVMSQRPSDDESADRKTGDDVELDMLSDAMLCPTMARSFTDDQMWQALEQSGLRRKVESFKKGLDEEVTEGGGNFSQGERQLLCLARALLRGSKILLLDEATSSIDPLADAVVQATIRRAFKDCTVLTVAHRLDTILDSDRILVMDQGRVAEFDSPERLSNRKDSIFRSLLDARDDH